MDRTAPADKVRAASAGELTAGVVPASGGLAEAVIAAVGSRVLIFAVAFAASVAVGTRRLPIGWRFPVGAEVFTGLLGHLLNPWAHWDGVWFIKIATSGYADGDGSTAFFPLYPLLLRYVGVLFGGNLVTTGIVISLLCYAGCVCLLFRLVRADFDERTASRAVVYLALWPLSFFLQAVYTESLFLMLSLACFAFAREGRWRLAGVAGLLAALTRSTGVLLIIPMVFYYYQARGWSLKRTDAHAANLLMVVEGLLVWMTYLSLTFGKPLLFSTAQASWERSLATPNYTVLAGFLYAVWGTVRLVAYQYSRTFTEVALSTKGLGDALSNVVFLLFFVLAALLLWYGARRLPATYSWYALAVLAYPLFFPSQAMPLMSYPRFMLTAFPLYVALALFTRDRPKLHAAVVAIGVVLLLAFTAQFAVFSFVS